MRSKREIIACVRRHVQRFYASTKDNEESAVFFRFADVDLRVLDLIECVREGGERPSDKELDELAAHVQRQMVEDFDCGVKLAGAMSILNEEPSAEAP